MTATHLKSFALFIAFCLTLSIYSCRQDSCKQAPNVSDIDLEVKIERFDQDFFSMIDTNDVANSLDKVNEKYPVFGPFFLEYLKSDANSIKFLIDELHYSDPMYVLQYFADAGYDIEAMKNSIIKGAKTEIKNTNDFIQLIGFNPKTIHDTLSLKSVRGIVTYPGTQMMLDTLKTVYGDISDLETELTQAFKYYKHYFPKKETPRILSMYSEFTNPVAGLPDDNLYAISLEWFFGINYPAYYQMEPPTPQYIARTLYRDHITSKVMQTLIDNIVQDSTASSLLDYMVYKGKKLYLLDKLLPCTPDYIKLECTPEQAKWLNQNEMGMWSEVFVEKLFDSNYKDFQKYVGPSPHSPDMPAEAPGNTGSFIGWKMVEAFVKNNPNYKLEQMLQITDGQEFLKLSKFKPKK